MLNFCPNYLAKDSDYILVRLFGSLLKFKACSKYSCLHLRISDCFCLISPIWEHWMIYSGPSFLAVVWFGSSTTPHPLSVCSTGSTQEDWERETTCWRERGGGRGAKLYDRKKSWPSYNQTIVSVPHISKSISFLLQEQSPLSLLERNYGIPRLDQLEAMDRLRETRIDGAGHATGVLLFVCSVYGVNLVGPTLWRRVAKF